MQVGGVLAVLLRRPDADEVHLRAGGVGDVAAEAEPAGGERVLEQLAEVGLVEGCADGVHLGAEDLAVTDARNEVNVALGPLAIGDLGGPDATPEIVGARSQGGEACDAFVD